MNSLNSILLEGNLTQDPELGATPKGTAVCNFRIAANRFYRQNEELQKDVYFFDVETWARLAERCAGNLEKGRGVRVVGRLRQDRWSDAEGNPHSRIKVVAEHVEFKPRFRTKEELLADEAEANAEAAAEAAEAGAAAEHEAGREAVAAQAEAAGELNLEEDFEHEEQSEPVEAAL